MKKLGSLKSRDIFKVKAIALGVISPCLFVYFFSHAAYHKVLRQLPTFPFLLAIE